MWYVKGIVLSSEKLGWDYRIDDSWNTIDRPWDGKEGVIVSFHLFDYLNQIQRRQAIKEIERILKKNDVPWIIPGPKEWTLDLDKLKTFIPDLSSMSWFKGKISIEPEFETEERVVFGKPEYDKRVALYIVPEDVRETTMPSEPPIEIKESLIRFKEDYSNPDKVAFIMMRFVKTKAHDEIVNAIRSVLDSHGITGVRSDDKQYHDDLFPNVLTYLYGCGFGVAVFERIEAEEFNPNVSLEVGYMLALKKPVCLLKDKTLKTLHADLVGKLYKDFDPQDPIKTIPDNITQWLSDKGIV